MTQEEIAHKIEVFARRLSFIATSPIKAHNYEKEMLIKDIQILAGMLKFTKGMK